MSNITIVGCGYVGMSLAVMLSKKYKVIAYDTDHEKVDKINKRISPIKDPEIEKVFKSERLNLISTIDAKIAYERPEFIIISTPTNFDPVTNFFDTSIVEKVASEALKMSPDSTLIIKSTVPIGFTDSLRKKLGSEKIIFSPEFLREGTALYDNLNPSRIILGDSSLEAEKFANILQNCMKKDKKDVKVFFFSSAEAEAVKLFSNTYLAARISFFNELDNFCLTNSLNTSNVINGVCSDSRISFGYNNPSFGFGGYCLPKDTKQLSANFLDIPHELISSVNKSNLFRKEFIVEKILESNPKTVGIYKLAMKHGSDNFRESAVLYIAERLAERNIKILIYDPALPEKEFGDMLVVESISIFKDQADIIIANRHADELEDVMNKTFTRDIFGEN